MKRRKPPRLRKPMLSKYVIVGLSGNQTPTHNQVKSLLSRIVNR